MYFTFTRLKLKIENTNKWTLLLEIVINQFLKCLNKSYFCDYLLFQFKCWVHSIYLKPTFKQPENPFIPTQNRQRK